MNKRLLVSASIILLISSLNIFANDDDRLKEMEQDILLLEQRITELENKMQMQIDEGDGSSMNGVADLSNWRKLATGMSMADVRKLLGEPERISGGSLSTWYYMNWGSVMFDDDRVLNWSEPRRR